MKFVDKGGRTRQGKEVTCPVCTQKFYTRIDQIQKTCSVECRYKARRNRISFNCAFCQKQVWKTPSKTHTTTGLHFCSVVCKDQARRIHGGIEAARPSNYKNGVWIDYRKIFAGEDLYCRRCGYKEFVESVEIHHIDKDRTNNRKENLIPLCACCHTGLHHHRWNIEELIGPLV